MSQPVQVLGVLALVSALLIVIPLARPGLIRARGGKVLVLLGFLLLPLLVTWRGATVHLEHARTTQFCLSCHEMEPYGRSLRVDDKEHLPAVHFQNRWIDAEHACFTCHTEYTMFGDMKSKLRGLRHVWVHYLGTPPERIALYSPYQNRECLHCHGGARRYEEDDVHRASADEIASGKLSCLECHEQAHDVAHLAELPEWKGR